MSCVCVNTAVIMQNENEKLREKIRLLEYKLKKYQQELLYFYSNKKNNTIVAFKSHNVPKRLV